MSSRSRTIVRAVEVEAVVGEVERARHEVGGDEGSNKDAGGDAECFKYEEYVAVRL